MNTINQTNHTTQNGNPAPGREELLSEGLLTTLLTPEAKPPVVATSTGRPQPFFSGASGARARPQQVVRLAQPLIVIGVGGTGRQILTLMKALLLDWFGVIPTNAALLAFDSGSEVITTRNRYGRVVELQANSEYIALGNVPIANIKRQPHFHPEMAARLGPALHQIQRPNIIHGAASERMQGLAVLYYHAHPIVREIRRALQRVTERTNQIDERADVPGMNILLVGSTAGGQGSGALLDMALLVREELLTLGEWADVARMAALLVLPCAFNNLDQRNTRLMIPNTMAFLRELDALMRGARLELAYPGHMQVLTGDAPFDYVFVVEGIDERGYNWPNLEEVAHMAARGLGLLLCSEVGLAETAFSVTKGNALNRISPTGYRTYLATLGLAELYYPGKQVAEICILRHAGAVLDHALAPVAGEAHGEQQPAPPAPPPDLQQWRQQVQSETPIPLQIRLPADIEEAEAAQIPPRTRNYVALFLQQRVYGAAFGRLQEAAQQQAATLLESHLRWLERVNAPGQIMLTAAALATARQRVEAARAALQTEQQAMQEAIEQQKRAVTAADDGMNAAAESFPLGRRPRTLSAAHRYVDECLELATLEVQQHRLALLSEGLRQVQQWLDGQVQRGEQAAQRLRQVRDHLLAAEKQLAGLQLGHNVLNLADESLVAVLYAQSAPDALTTLQNLSLAAGGLLAWANQTPETILQQLVSAGTPAFAPLAEATVEDVLRQRWPDRNVDYWVGVLEQLAAGAWNLDRAKLPPGSGDLASFLTIGVTNADESLFARTAYACTSTGDPQRIVALRTVYGASLDALKAAPRWERIYQGALHLKPSIHIFTSFDQDEERQLHSFGLGLVFGSIYKQGNYYRYRPADSLEQTVQLGNGRENAFAAFAADDRLPGEVLARAEGEIARIGVTRAIQQIEGWVDSGAEKDDPFTIKLRRAVRTYVEQMK